MACEPLDELMDSLRMLEDNFTPEAVVEILRDEAITEPMTMAERHILADLIEGMADRISALDQSKGDNE